MAGVTKLRPHAARMFLSAAIIVSGCSGGDRVNESKVTAQSSKMNGASAFADVIGPGPTTMPDGTSVSFDVYLLGPFSLPSGRIVAADGFIAMGAAPFTHAVKPGTYPVTVAVACFGEDERIAFAQMRFSEKRVAKWEMALKPGQDPAKLTEGKIYSYGVDSSTGCFADFEAQDALTAKGSDKLADDAMAEMKKVYRPTRQCALIDTPKGSVALFTSGWGDGGYASYFGIDDNGEVATLITDFAVVGWARRP